MTESATTWLVDSPQDVAPQRGRPLSWWGVGALVAFGIVLHTVAGVSFPRPWPDESHFIAPALQLAEHATLGVPQLNAPAGIFWMPSGYYVAIAPVLLLFPAEPLLAARALSLVGVIAAALALAATATRAGVPRPVAVGVAAVWLSLPRVVAAGNIARMEALVLALTGLSIWLIARDRWPYAVAATALAPLIHPVGVVALVAVAAASLLRRTRRPWTVGERVALAVVVGLWIAEVAYFVTYADTAAADLRFQFLRKAGRSLEIGVWHGLWLPVAAAAGGAATWAWRRATPVQLALWTCLAAAGGYLLVDLVGHELWYGVLGRETAVLLIGVAGLGAVSRMRWSDLALTAAVGLVAVAVVGGTYWTGAHGWNDMRPATQSTAEWRAFVTEAVSTLQTLDAQPGPLRTVALDPLSGFGQEVFSRPWRRLRFVQPTPVTEAGLGRPDYLLTTPGAPFVTAGLSDGWGEATVEVESPDERFKLKLYGNPDGG